MSDIIEIKHALNSRAQSVAEMLLPGGRREGNEWRAGSTNGEAGKSLGVNVSGDKAGIWSDFATGETGDLLDLWMAARNCSLSEAINQARTYCGITRPERYKDKDFKPKSFTRPPRPKCNRPANLVRDYLTENRNLPEATIDAYRVGEQGRNIVFPFLYPTGELVMAKKREAVDGADPMPMHANCEPILFGWQVVPADAREIIITEGEMDAMSWHAFGFPAMSVPYGGGKGAKQQWIEYEFERLDRFERIYISTDMDKAGEEAALEIMSRLGRHRCYRVELPLKDANDCLVEGYTPDQMHGYLKAAKSYDPDGLRRASDYLDQVEALFYPDKEEHQGYHTPYKSLGTDLLFRPSELTIWTGATGAGKSQILSDCAVDWVNQGSRICIASLEMVPKYTLKRMVKQAGGVDLPARAYLPKIFEFLGEGVLLYEKVGKSGVDGLLEVFDYARAKYGCDQFIIDSLMRLGIASDDYNGQEKAVFRLTDWAISNGVHVHLVAHARKGERGSGAPESEDIKGASEIGANAFNIISVWRNREHEEKIKKAAQDEVQDLEDKPGVMMNVAKQRNGDFEGRVGLWFNQANYQYRSYKDDKRRKPYVEAPGRAEVA